MTFLKYKRAWIIPLAIAFVVGMAGLWSRTRVGTELNDKLEQEILTILNANATALEIWLGDQTRMAKALADDHEVYETMVTILSHPVLKSREEPVRQKDRGFLLPAQLEFNRLTSNKALALSFPSAILVNSSGIIVGDSGPQGRLLGKKVFDDHWHQFDKIFDSGKSVFITPFKMSEIVDPTKRSGSNRPEILNGKGENIQPRKPGPAFKRTRNQRINPNRARRQIFGKSLMQVAVPVKDKSNNIVGALSVIIDADKEFSRILSVARTGETGETIAFDASGLMLSTSRFDKDLKSTGLLDNDKNGSALNMELRDPGRLIKTEADLPEDINSQPLTFLADQALTTRGQGVEIDAFRDYRGKHVVGGWKWMPRLGLGLVSKIDENEANRPLHVLTLVFIALFLLLILFAMGMVTFSYLNISLYKKFDLAQLQAKQLGQYSLENKIGEGGMGVVYKARHALLRRETAIKLLSPDIADGEAIARFEREVKMTCRLTHPNTIQVYDYGHTPDGIFYYAMEYLEGMNLQQMVARYGAQADAHVIYILSAICESLNEAHMSGLIHRDIKPANIFLCERGGMAEVVKVLDFGLVKEFSDGMNIQIQAGPAKNYTGTPNFMSPESVVDSEEVDHLSDIYAVGAIGHYLLTGDHLFPDAHSVQDIFHAQLNEQPLTPSQRLGWAVCPQLEEAIMACLHKDHTLRPQSAIDLWNLLAQCQEAGVWDYHKRLEWWNGVFAEAEEVEVHDGQESDAFAEALKIDVTERFSKS